MLNRLISNDQPRSRLLAALLIVILLGLAFAPFLFPGVKALSVAAKVLIFVVLVAGFDLLLGYTGIVSFAHTMFFGIGAYGVAVASTIRSISAMVSPASASARRAASVARVEVVSPSPAK